MTTRAAPRSGRRVPAPPAPAPSPPARTTPRRAWTLVAALVVAALPAVPLRDAVADAAALHALAAAPNPYWIPDRAALLYLAVPAAAVGACALFLAPGLLLAVALGDGRGGAARWLLHGFAISLVVVSAAAALAQALLGAPPTGLAFAALVAALAAAAAALLALRLRRGALLPWPLAAPGAQTTLSAAALGPALLAAALAPKLLWEAFNGDGAHAYETARLLLHRPLPFWGAEAGEVAGFPGTTSFLFAYPVSWFVRLFGPLEASARLPLLLFLALAFAGVAALAEQGRGRPMRPVEDALLWLALAAYAVTVGFSASYSPYSADLALPATQDTLLVVSLLGFVLAFARDERGWMAAWTAAAVASLPNGLVLLGLWTVAAWLVLRPRPTGRIAWAAACLVGCLAAAMLAPRLLTLAGLPAPGGEYGATGLLRRFAWLQGTEAVRLAYWIVPGGIVPAVALLAWRRQDGIARALTLTTATYFAFTFVQAHATLHYYIPAMLLPLAVLWRVDPAREPRRRPWVLAATAAGGVAALLLALPEDGRPFTAAREAGRTIELAAGDYAAMEPAAFRASTALSAVAPYDWDPAVPEDAFGSSPLVLQFYAAGRTAADGPAALRLAPSDAPVPAGMREVARERGVSLLARGGRVPAEVAGLRPSTETSSPLFRQPRGLLFRSEPWEGAPPVLDVPAALERAGLPVDRILARLGAAR